MTEALEKRREERKELREAFLGIVGGDYCSDSEQLNYELWLQQKERCLYCDKAICAEDLRDGKNKTEIEHIWPRSRVIDNSFINKTLACVACNRNKSGQTPWEWKGRDDSAWWREFRGRVDTMDCRREKKRRLLAEKSADDLRDEGFANRHKTDSSYIARRLLQALQTLYPESYHSDGRFIEGARRPLFARPGALTGELRTLWLRNVWKKDREDDRHNAVDALVVALTSEKILYGLARRFQSWEEKGFSTHRLRELPPPWEGFAEDAKRALEGWHVSRSEVRRARGEGYKETIYGKRPRDGRLMKRVPVTEIAKKRTKLAALPDSAIGNKAVGEALAAWLLTDRQEPPRTISEKVGKRRVGDAIRSVRLETQAKAARPLHLRYRGDNKGYVLNSVLVRADIYCREGKGFYFVPVYNHQILNKSIPTPRRAVVAHKPESEWREMEEKDFLFSLYRWSYVVVKKKDTKKKKGEVIAGYYRGVDRDNGVLTISPHNKPLTEKRVGIKTLESLEKFAIDRLGRRFAVKREKFPCRRIGEWREKTSR